MNRAPQAEALRYRAFISYSHRDKAWAEWLHRGLETYRVPSRLVGQRTAAGVVPRRLAPVFRDRDELASSGDLGRQVNQALAQSANLIVICSPAAAASRWVGEEVLAFRRLGRDGRIFCLVVAGEPNAAGDNQAQECLPKALRLPLDGNGPPGAKDAEPVAADVRPGKDGKHNAKLKLVAGLLDLEFDQLRRRELQRRNRRLTALACLALLVMLVTSLLAIDAVIARHAAERRQKQAEALVDFMLGDLNDKLAQVQRLDIMEAVDDKAMDYFQSLPPTDITDEALQQRAKALEKIGSVRSDQGHLAAAMAAFQAAAQVAGPLADAAPDDPERQTSYAEILAFIGMTDWNLGDLDAAQRHFEEARNVLQRAQSHAAGDPELIFLLTSIDNNIGHVFEARGKLDQAEAEYRRMLVRCTALVAGRPPNAQWISQLGAAHNNLGKTALVRGDLAAALAEYAADDAIETGLSARDPKDNDQRENTVRVRATLGRTSMMVGNTPAGLLQMQQALDMATQLAKVDPSQTSFQQKVALYSSQLARFRRLTGDLPGASALVHQSLRIYSALTRQDPANADWQQGLAEARSEQAAQALAAGRDDLALGQVGAALKLLDPLLAKQPDDRATLLDTATARLQLAALTRDAPRARQLRERTLLLLQKVSSGRGDPRLLALQTDALLGMGRKDEATPVIGRLWASGYRDPALLSLLRHEQIDYPRNPQFEQRLASANQRRQP
ncbi:toll/interleukin-1 receptor domain-containing protein [Frateuria terrea]|uniref:MTH538 TIR-like domain n=1 Tax=Frateuria terrea TaxID=529704 RepID=A0A1H6VRI8_9GAMM|nr:toll/interleukin-1 receptor domain-containing protein [Frateuria terrea]SEJ05694.1 MTH538 TIR-like domain [Frateuria terrea]SFP70886.1 MTH538 TIR-like domain [Frateuria terrea]